MVIQKQVSVLLTKLFKQSLYKNKALFKNFSLLATHLSI